MTCRSQQGISLLESLIAMVVLTLGVLGLLAAQISTLGNTQNSMRRTQAIYLIDDLSERIKSMPDAVSSANHFAVGWSGLPAGASVPDCAAITCNSEQLAQFERQRWLLNVQQSLPMGQANVFVVSDEPRLLGVMLAWRANEKHGSDVAEQLAPPSTGGADVSCPADRICHLQYISLAQRCLSAGSSQTYCSRS